MTGKIFGRQAAANIYQTDVFESSFYLFKKIKSFKIEAL